MSFRYRIALSGVVIFGTVAAYAQHPSDVVHWTAKVGHISGTSEVLSIEGEIQPGWHVYAPSQQPGGPTPMTIKIAEGQGAALGGKVTEGPTSKKHDPQFDMDTVFFLKTARLSVPVTANRDSVGKSVLFDIRFQVCNETMCLPPTTVHTLAQGL